MTGPGARRFTIGKLEFRKLILSDYVYLIIYSCVVIGYFVTSIYYPENKPFYTLACAIVVGLFTTTFPFGPRFRNVYFSLIWLALSIVFIIDNYLIAWMPLLSFVLYHILRLIFWKLYHREFIPWQVGRGHWYRHKSVFENVAGTQRDKIFTGILLFAGALIPVVLMYVWMSQI